MIPGLTHVTSDLRFALLVMKLKHSLQCPLAQ
jgi:hypothetical protein